MGLVRKTMYTEEDSYDKGKIHTVFRDFGLRVRHSLIHGYVEDSFLLPVCL